MENGEADKKEGDAMEGDNMEPAEGEDKE